MTRARILADYVSSGDELALKAPITNAALVTPNLGTPSAGVMTNVTGMPASALSASGINSAKFLKGDNTWDTAGSTSASDLASGTLATARMAAGTVIQTTALTRGNTVTAVDTSSGYQSTVVTAGITPQNDDSTIMAFMNFVTYWVGEGTGDFGYAFRVIKAGTGISTTYPLGMYTSYGVTTQYHNAYYTQPGPAEAVNNHTLVLQDEDCETTNAITYTLQCAGYSVATTLDVGSNTWGNYQWSMYLQEIKR